MLTEEITLIIPHQAQANQIDALFKSMASWLMLPQEIIVVDSSPNALALNNDFLIFCQQRDIKLELIHEESIFPGHARNLGIQAANNDLLAFLDVHTTPNKAWLNDAYRQFVELKPLAIRGITCYEASTAKEAIIIASTFGFKSLQTLPGSLIHKKVFLQCGLFIENVRAGEDGDWMHRAHLHHIPFIDSTQHISYTGLSGITYRKIVTKWYRNYKYTHHLPFFQKHKDIYFYASAILLIILARNWNWVTIYLTGGLLFIPNVTKISLTLVFVSYFLIRVIFLPVKKGAAKILLNPLNLISIMLLSMILDLVKIAAFVHTKIVK
jgi:hypothetical protein